MSYSDYARDLNIPYHLIFRQDFEDVSSSKYARILNVTRLYMQGLHSVLNIPEYGSICHNNA